ncbi:MAG: hypothetical protein WBA57_20925 [Elainellaceae cyanobacterium]
MSLNNLKSLFRVKLDIGSAVLFLFVIFLLTFILGIYIGRIDPSQDLDTFQNILLGVILVSLIPIVVSLTSFIIKEEASKLSRTQLEEKEKEIENRDKKIESLKTAHHRRLSIIYRVKGFIDKSENHIKDVNLSELRRDLENQILELQKEEEAAKKIIAWLSEQTNKVLLMQHATKEAMSALNLDDFRHYRGAIETFKKDIFRCIEWLQASLTEGFPLRVRASKLANSIYKLPGELNNHKIALRAIERHPILREKANGTTTLNKLIDDLIYELDNEIKFSGGANRLTHISQRSSR